FLRARERGKQHAGKDGDDRNDNQQLNQGEGSMVSTLRAVLPEGSDNAEFGLWMHICNLVRLFLPLLPPRLREFVARCFIRVAKRMHGVVSEKRTTGQH